MIHRLEQFFITNEIKNERKKATFLSLIGSQAYALLKNLVSPNILNFKDKSYTELVATLKNHYRSRNASTSTVALKQVVSSLKSMWLNFDA